MTTTADQDSPQFTVVIPTRNRPEMLRTALASVLGQTGASFEVIVVDDGTQGAHADSFAQLEMDHAGSVRFMHLPLTPKGNGCFRVMNTGVWSAKGQYVAFLDDDDSWTDPQHLAKASAILKADGRTVDVIYFDQKGYVGDAPAPGPIWIEDLGESLRSQGLVSNDVCELTPNQLLSARGFPHTNTTVVRKDFFMSIGGFDVTLWYEGDRDFYLRTIDQAKLILYSPVVCARHNIPALAARSSMSNQTSAFAKARDQYRLLSRSAASATHADIRAHAARHRRYALRKAIDATARNPVLTLKLARLMISPITHRSGLVEIVGSGPATGP